MGHRARRGKTVTFTGVDSTIDTSSGSYDDKDVFGREEGHEIRFKTLGWKIVSVLMMAEVISNGLLSLPNVLAIVGIVPAVVLIVFLGSLALYTSILLINFKMNHPEVHTMGDAGYIMFGPVGREIMSAGTIIFAIAAAGGCLLTSQQALSVLSNNGLCTSYFVLISAVVVFLMTLPRTLDNLSWLGIFAVGMITVCGVLAMIAAGLNPSPDRVIQATASTNFYEGFLAITNPVFAYAGHFIFFPLISEMKKPQDAVKSAWCLQVFSTIFYIVFAVVMYVYLGSTVQSPVLFSLPPLWSKITFAFGLGNFLVTSALCSHTAAKLLFVRIFRRSRHLHSHTILSWTVWVGFCLLAVGAAAVLAIGIPIFPYLISISASLFASWYTYGIAGFFWLYDTYKLKGGVPALRRNKFGTIAATTTILIGAFICVAGTYVSVKLIIDAYHVGLVGKPFAC